MRILLVGLALCLAVCPALSQRDARIPDPDPEIERKSFTVAPGFEVNLFAADPQLAKPIQMNFDSAGRLWLACSETYPQIKPGAKANDKIIVLEDTRGTGKADKVTVFADGLLIPTGLEPGDGGVYVANSTDLIHLADTDGDGKADRRKVVLSGFGTEDTHHIIHTLRWGHDGNLYFNQSVYIHSHIETPYGPRRLNAGGVWQLRPDRLRLEVFTRGLWNTWGHHFDRFGQSFLTDGAGFMGICVGFPGATFDPSPGAARTLKGLNMGSPKYCGLEIVSGRHLPEDWQGDLITCDFRAHRVCRFKLAPVGSGFTARLMPDVIKATHPAFRPIDVKVGPDGAIYVADWYNPIIQHGEVDFRDPRRDVTHGRIWRITAKNRPLVPRPNLPRATPTELAKQLQAPEGWTRHFARRELQARGIKTALPAVEQWQKSLTSEADLLEALWTYQTLDVVREPLLRTLLRAKDSRVRAAAVRVLSAWQDRVADTPGLLAAAVTDEDPLVRREAVTALQQVRSVRAAELALHVLNRPVDEYLDYALWLTMRELEPLWLPALQAGKFDFGGNIRRLTFALQAVGSDKVVRPLVQLIQKGKLPADSEDGVLGLLASVGGPDELRQVVERGLALTGPRQEKVLTALEERARQSSVRPAGSLDGLVKLLGSREDRVRALASRLIGDWRIESGRAGLVELAGSKEPVEVRKAAIDGLVGLGGIPSKTVLERLAESEAVPALRQAAVIGLAALDLPAAAKRIRGVLEQSKDGSGAAEVFAAFLQRKGGAAILTTALAEGALPQDVARVGIRVVRTSGREAPGLVEALTRAGGLTAGTRKLSPAELKEMVTDVVRMGNPERGEAIYRRGDQLCLRCHAIGGAGGQVGPDLSSIGAATQIDYLIESLLLPSKAIKENYNAILVTTRRGQQYTGIKVRQTATALILRNEQDAEISIPLKDIEEQGASKTSLMPEGLTDNLTRAELVDLVAFLSNMGKGERWSVGRARVARRWQVLAPTQEILKGLDRKDLPGLAADSRSTWEPVYTQVSGSLPLEGLARFRAEKKDISLLRTQLEANTASKIALRLEEVKGLKLWLDGQLLNPAKSLPVTLTPGLHTVVVAIDHSERKEDLRLEVEDGEAAAGVRFVGGK